jgi:hypothetical protein
MSKHAEHQIEPRYPPMTDPLDLDAISGGALVMALVAELRTARAALVESERQYQRRTDELLAAEARIEAAAALCDAADAQVHDHFGGDGSMVNVAQIRDALSGATEPAAHSEPTCPLHGLPLGPAPAKNCPDCRRQIAHTLGEETR